MLPADWQFHFPPGLERNLILRLTPYTRVMPPFKGQVRTIASGLDPRCGSLIY
jgi:hypothetical protein